jgi:hypothetical protein
MTPEQNPPVDRANAAASPQWRSLLDGAARLGVYSWWERRLFEVLGVWSTDEQDPALKVLLDAQSHQHAWHAEVFFARLPELREVDAESLVRAPSGEVAAVLDDLAATGGTIERLVGVHRVVVPHLLACYSHDLELASAVAEPATRRWLALISGDLAASRAEGERHLLGLLRRGQDVDVAAESQRRLERALVLAGGPTGDGPTAG